MTDLLTEFEIKKSADVAVKRRDKMFRAVKQAEDRAAYFDSKLKHIIEMYKPL